MNVIEEFLTNVRIGPSASFRDLTVYPSLGVHDQMTTSFWMKHWPMAQRDRGVDAQCARCRNQEVCCAIQSAVRNDSDDGQLQLRLRLRPVCRGMG